MPSSRSPLSFRFESTNTTEQFRPEMRGDRVVGLAELLADVVLGHAARFPSAIEMFEPLSGELGLGSS